MKIVAFEGQGGARLGVVEGDHVDRPASGRAKAPDDLGEVAGEDNGDL